MSGAWLLVFYLLVPLEAYLGVTNVTFVDTASVFGFIGGVISWTPPSDLTHVTGYRAWLGVNEDSELADFFNGLGIFAKGVWDYKVSASSTQIEFDPIEPLATITRERCRYLQVYAELDGAWQTRADLLDGADILFYDRGWTGTSLPFTQQDVSFVDTDLRCGFLGGAVRFALPSTADPTALKYWRVYFSDDLQGSNPSTEFQLPMSFSNSVTLPGDYQHGTRTVLNIAGVNDDIELTMRIPFQDDCGGVPEVVFTSLSFDDQDPGQELISGTVHVDLPLQYSDQYTALRLYLAYDGSGLGRTQIGAALAPFEFQFTVAAGTRLDSRDYLLVYAENAYGEQPPVSLLVKDYVLWPEAPGESSVVQSIQFQDEDNIYGKLDGLVKWVPGSMTVTTYFVVFVATDSGAEVQVSPEVPADAAHEWHITVTLDTSGEPYTQLLVYAGNNVGLSNYSSAIPLEDGRTTCTSATYWPCARFQVLKEAPPVGCAADFCTAEECCTVAGLCWDFFAGAQNASAIELSELEVEVEWSPYLLQPDLPEEGAPKEASIPERLRQDGEKLGLKFGEAARVPNTVKAHCLLLHALESQGRRAQNRVAEVLFRQYHCEGKCPEVENLVAAAEEAGLGEAREVLMDRRYEQRVREEAAAAARRIPSVPLCVFESGQQLAGAQEVETFLEALKGGSQSSEAPV